MAAYQQTKNASVVIDVGSSISKFGLAGGQIPKTMPSAVGIGGENDKEIFFGAAARGKGTIKNPVECGVVKDWDVMEKVCRHILDTELRVPGDGRRVLLAESPLSPKPNREKATEIMFEALDVKGFYIAMDAVLSLYASGRKDGLVVESGHGVTHVVAAAEGNPLFSSILKVDTSGKQLTEELTSLLSKSGLNIQDIDIVNTIKESCCRVALDFGAEVASLASKKESYELPDGQKIDVGDWKFSCPESMFKPQGGIHYTICDVVCKCDQGLSKTLFGNIVLAGGNTLFPGLEGRVEKEMKALAPKENDVHIVVPQTRATSAWIGGSILATLEAFQPMLITKEEFKETGPSIVHKKCI